MQETIKSGGANATRVSTRAHAQNVRVRQSGFAAPAAAPAVSEVPGGGEVVSFSAPPRLGRSTIPIGGWSKRAFDIVMAGAALIVLAPLLLVIAIAVRCDSRGQSIFRQERGGFRGKTFRIWKFRTMIVTENRGVVQARRNDARVTELGAFLRRSSLDELPQLINVLLGDMSIIGPRPHALEHDAQFEEVDTRYSGRFSARPGVTGLAQVNGCRGPTETAEKIRARTGYDIEYVHDWSWAKELKILARTAALFWKHDPGAL